MKLNNLIQFRLKESAKGLITLYGLVLLSFLLVFAITIVEKDTHTIFSGTELTTCVYLFVAGLVSFRPLFHLCLQNGISRKTMYLGYMISSFIISVGMALFERVLYTLLKGNKSYQSAFQQIYIGKEYDSLVVQILVQFIWYLSAFFFCSILGYFISTLFYHLNRNMRIYVFIGVPFGFLVLLPLTDYLLTGGRGMSMLARLFQIMLGIYDGNHPIQFILTFILGTVIFIVLGRLLTRRSVLRKD